MESYHLFGVSLQEKIRSIARACVTLLFYICFERGINTSVLGCIAYGTPAAACACITIILSCTIASVWFGHIWYYNLNDLCSSGGSTKIVIMAMLSFNISKKLVDFLLIGWVVFKGCEVEFCLTLFRPVPPPIHNDGKIYLDFIWTWVNKGFKFWKVLSNHFDYFVNN